MLGFFTKAEAVWSRLHDETNSQIIKLTNFQIKNSFILLNPMHQFFDQRINEC